MKVVWLHWRMERCGAVCQHLCVHRVSPAHDLNLVQGRSLGGRVHLSSGVGVTTEVAYSYSSRDDRDVGLELHYWRQAYGGADLYLMHVSSAWLFAETRTQQG